MFALWLATAVADPWSALQANERRVATIAYRLQTNGGALCPDKMPLTGLVLHDRAQYARADRTAVAARFGLKARPGVLAVVPESPAAQAGIAPGDALAAIDGVAVPPTPQSASGYAPLGAIEAKLDAAHGNTLRISRDGVERDVTLAPRPGCRSRVQIIPGKKSNAHADGFYVQLTPVMIAETTSDDELAFVIAHEIAHNILSHRAKRMGGRASESQADTLAIRMMNAARYDIDAAAAFWAKFGAKTGYGIFSDGSHLRTKARVRLLSDTAAQVRADKPPGSAQ